MDASSETARSVRHLVLDLRDAVPPAEHAAFGMAPLTLAVPAGSLLLIEVADWQQAATLGDLATGQVTPGSGSVSFLGRNWATLPPLHADAMRGRIGHVFRRGNWMEGLTILDNILLPHRYHTRRPVAELEADAIDLATRLGLPGVPIGLPADADREDLQCAACIRAFLGRPALVILEEPTQALAADVVEPLINVIRRARDRDTAVLWLTEDQAICADHSLPATARYRLRDVLYRIASQPVRGVP